MAKRKKLTPGIKDYILENHGKISYSGMARELGISVNSVARWSKRLGIAPCVPHPIPKGYYILSHVSDEIRNETYRKVSDTRRKVLRKERARFAFGLEQRTAIRLIRQTDVKKSYRCRMKRYGYIPCGYSILYYTPDTRRCVVAERNAARHNIKILPHPEHTADDTAHSQML